MSTICIADTRESTSSIISLNYEKALIDVTQSIINNVSKIGDRNPKIGNENLKYDYCGPSDWVSGFWAGQLWLAYKITGEQTLKNSAKLRKFYHKNLLNHPNWLDHDLGFQFSLTSVAEYKLTGDKESRELAIKAADALLTRFRRIGKYIVAWNETHELGLNETQGRTIIDSLQNVSLLFWAAKETSNDCYKNAAIEHSNTLMKYIVRSDFSTYHTYKFDPSTQQPIRGETFQGYSDESCWSRGQAWAIHGYAQIFEHTDEQKYLDLAKNLAKYAIQRLPHDGIPLWDFNLPESEHPYRDSSAASIMAAGFLLIATYCSDEEKPFYTNAAVKILTGLKNQCDLTAIPSAEGLLSEGASFVNGGLHDNMLPYGDYYYLEALMRLNGYTDFFWK